MKPACALLVMLSIFLNAAAQTSSGTTPLASKVVSSQWDPECSMTDIGHSFFNDRLLVCSQNQTRFFNGEIRFVDFGVGIYGSLNTYNGYELTSCACPLNATWTRTMGNVITGEDASIRWTWKFYARRDDCSLELKRDLVVTGCSYPLQCNCPEGTTCGIMRDLTTCVGSSPIAIDMDGDGLRLTDRASGVKFDLDGDGQHGQMPWLEEDGWLVLDDREDGVIHDGRQLFGDRSAQDNWPNEQPNGYAALRTFDDNGDNRLDPADGIWRLLAIWQDANNNGISEPGEVRSLDVVGIAVIHLSYRESRRRDSHGNELRYRARVEWTSGRHSSSWDVFLAAD